MRPLSGDLVGALERLQAKRTARLARISVVDDASTPSDPTARHRRGGMRYRVRIDGAWLVTDLGNVRRFRTEHAARDAALRFIDEKEGR